MSINMETAERRKRGRLTLVLIASVFIVPLLVAAWMQRVAMETGVWGGTQHGTLIEPPLPLRDFRLPTWQGSAFTLAELKGKWAMLYMVPAPAECAAECRQAVYHMRQIRLALGKDMNRVQRVLLVMPESGWLEEITKEYEGMHILIDAGAVDSLRQQLEPQSAQNERGIYLLDPLGNAMMIYTPAADPRDILKDLKKLLRNSKVG
jgi:cytochrome oxidase Cu insertion factor (SCO1/SenC/PrrC family)